MTDLPNRAAMLAARVTLNGRDARIRDAGNGFADVYERRSPQRRIRTCWAAVEHVCRDRAGEFWG